MSGGAMAVVTAFLSVVALLLEAWAQNRPQRNKEKADDATQKGRQDIVDGDVDAVSERIDKLLSAELQGRGSARGPNSQNQDG